MPVLPPDDTAAVARLRTQRLTQLLHELAAQGVTQGAVAAAIRSSPQVVSDLRHGRRTLSELVARRLAEEFKISLRWLLGESETAEPESHAVAPRLRDAGLYVPLLRAPISGDPREHPDWDGAEVELCGVAAARARQSRKPYALQFNRDDSHGVLRTGDLLLISQDVLMVAEFSAVRHRGRVFLARRDAVDGWIRVADGARLASAKAIGHAVGIIWRAFGETCG